MTSDADCSPLAVPREHEWHPNECQFCTADAARSCPDPACRQAHLGEPDGAFSAGLDPMAGGVS